MKNAIRLSIILIGFTAMASQIIYMRELLVVFYGNELSISFILASWLVAGAIGSAVLGRFADLPSLRGPKGRSNLILTFSLCQIALGILLPAGIVAARLIKTVLHVNPGEIISLFPIITASFIILAPVCIILGFMFSLACSIQAGIGNHGFQSRLGIVVGNVYILEAGGSIIGGALTSFILIRFLTAIQITSVFAILNFISAFSLILFLRVPSLRGPKGRSNLFLGLFPASASPRSRNDYMVISIFFLIITATFALWPSGIIRRIDDCTLQKQWEGYDLLVSKNSIYGNVAIVRRGEDFSFFDNGLHLYTIPDKLNSEEAVHLALLEHPDPGKILLIGGGVGGLIEEILKHPVEKVDYVELDPMIITMAARYLPNEYYNALRDSRVSIKNLDGRSFVKTTKERYDCVIVHVGDPYTAGINRYYTEEFFKEAKDILNEGGILSFGLTSSESYISDALGEFLSSVYFTLKEAFGDCLVMPGDTAYFMASKDKKYLTYDYKILEERTKRRSLDTQYVREYYLFSKLSPEKVSYINSVLERKTDVRINRDFKPASYYYGLIFWTTLFKDSVFSRILKSINEDMIWKGAGVFIITLTLMLAFFRRSFKRTALVAITVGGFSTMAFQVLILLAFQIMYGYLFYKLGIILTAFMAGLAIGALFAVKVIHSSRAPLRVPYCLMAVQGGFLLYSLILPVFFLKGGLAVLFPVMSLVAGFIGGSQFPLISKVLLAREENVGKIGGLTYGVDLIGSFFGALLTGILLIPILGIPKTCIAIALINLAVLGLLALNVSIEE